MRPIKKKEIITELRRIATAQDGVLLPEHIVNAASSPRSVLHKYFDWDDSEAAQKWRIHQARMMLNVVVTVLPRGNDDPTRVYVSLTTDRGEGGYRAIVDVLSDPEMRGQLLADAFDELKHFKQKYHKLTELSDVFAAMSRAELRTVNRGNGNGMGGSGRRARMGKAGSVRRGLRRTAAVRTAKAG